MLIVTGATGLLGNAVVRRAVARGRATMALVRATSQKAPLHGLPVRTRTADLLNDDLTDLIGKGDVVVHAAARVAIGRRDLQKFHTDNVASTARLAAACRAARARLVHVSTVDTLRWGSRDAPGDETRTGDGRAPSAYSFSKRQAEQVVAREIAAGLDAVTVHPAFLLGPNDWKPSSGRMVLDVAAAPLLLAPPGGNDFCHVEDVADGIITAAMKAPTGAHYVLGGEALSYFEAFGLIRRVAGRPARVIAVPSALARIGGLAGDLIAAVTGREPAVNSVSVGISCLPHHFSSARAERELGYRNRGAEAAIRDAWTWFVAHGYA